MLNKGEDHDPDELCTANVDDPEMRRNKKEVGKLQRSPVCYIPLQQATEGSESLEEKVEDAMHCMQW